MPRAACRVGNGGGNLLWEDNLQHENRLNTLDPSHRQVLGLLEASRIRESEHGRRPTVPRHGMTVRDYFLRRFERFFFAAFLSRVICFFRRAISRCCLRDLAFAFFRFFLADALAFFSAEPLAFLLAFFRLRFAI